MLNGQKNQKRCLKMTKLQEFDLDWIDLYIEKLIEESIWYEI